MNQPLSNKKRQTKIVATLGPATESKEQIAALLKAGANVFRLNFSHGSHDSMRERVQFIRELEEETGRPIAILADLQGPKLRLGKFQDGSAPLELGQKFRFDSNTELGDSTRVHLPHPEILEILNKGNQIFLDDGKVRIEIVERGSDETGAYLIGEVQAGSKLSNHKGFNLPDAVVPVPALTEKDKVDLQCALEIGADWIAQSFVQQPEDVEELLNLVQGRAAVMVKLEKPSALTHLDELLRLADGFMLARGDLGVEIPPEDVPGVQKRVVRAVHAKGKPIVVATQMLESMIENARPTRAEASDVATAVYDGADAVMLSAETAAGDYPVEAVEIMDRICRRTEGGPIYKQMMDLIRNDIDNDMAHDISVAITTSAYYVAKQIDASLIVTYTASGSTSIRAARMRPSMPVVSLTPDIKAARRLAVSYGLVPIVHSPEQFDNFSGPVNHATKLIKDYGFAQKGECFVMTAGVPFAISGTTNILRVAEVE